MLEFDDLGRVPLVHFDLGLAQGGIFSEVLFVLALEKGDFLRQLLDSGSRLSLDISCDFLIFCLTCTFQSFNLVLQLLVLILQLSNLLVVILLAVCAYHTGRHSAFSQSCKLSCHLCIFLHLPLMLSVEFLVLCDHALFVYEHLIEVFELLREEDCLVAHHRINTV